MLDKNLRQDVARLKIMVEHLRARADELEKNASAPHWSWPYKPQWTPYTFTTYDVTEGAQWLTY